MGHDVFISYSTVDQKIVEGLSAYLEQQGIRCFVAYRDIPKGVVWAKAITDAIEKSKLMVVVFSEHFNRSDQVDREIELCIEEGQPILTFKIQDSAFTGAKKYYLKNLNWIDAFPIPNKYFGELCNSIKVILNMGFTRISKIESSKNTGRDSKKNRKFNKIIEAAEQGNHIAQYNLGVMYHNGRGVPRDYVKAAEWYRKAAEQGDSAAQCILGAMYHDGQGVRQNDYKSIEWYRKAAEQGDANAQSSLGVMYQFARGVPCNYVKAKEWYRKAAKQGYANAIDALNVLNESNI